MYTSDNDGTEKRILLFVLVDIGDWIFDIGGVRRESWRAWIKRGEFWLGRILRVGLGVQQEASSIQIQDEFKTERIHRCIVSVQGRIRDGEKRGYNTDAKGV